MHQPNNLFKRIRSSLLAFAVVIAVALFAIAPAVMAQIPVGQEFSQRRIRSGAALPSANISNSGNNANICPTIQQITNTGNVANQQGVSQYNPGGPGFNPGGPGFDPRDPGFKPGDPGFKPGDPGFKPGDPGINAYSPRFFGFDPFGFDNRNFDNGNFDNGNFDNGNFDNGNNGDIAFDGSSINIDGSASSNCTQTINQIAAAGASPGVVAAVGGGGPGGGGPGGGGPGGGGPGGGGPGGGGPGGGGGVAAKAGGGMLPSTGGVAPALALGAGVLLAGGGLLAYRRFMM